MATNESLTPEKQLLKLIENPKQASVRAESAKREGKKWFSFPAFKGRLDFWKGTSVKQWFSLKKFSQSAHGVGQINVVLKVLIVLVAIYTGYSVYQMAKGIKSAANLILTPDPITLDVPAPVTGLQSVSYYLEKIRGRNIFVSAQPEPIEEEETAPEAGVPQEDPFKDFALVGIAWSNDPEAMVEDTKLNKTFFMKRGQSMANGVRVVTIFKDKVILGYKDRESELR
jgi:hypothetical protein